MTPTTLSEAAAVEFIAELGLPDSAEDAALRSAMYEVALEVDRALRARHLEPPTIPDLCRLQARALVLTMRHGPVDGAREFRLEQVRRRLERLGARLTELLQGEEERDAQG